MTDITNKIFLNRFESLNDENKDTVRKMIDMLLFRQEHKINDYLTMINGDNKQSLTHENRF